MNHTDPQSGLRGYVMGVTADRRAEEQIGLLTARGAECVHGPVIKTHPFDAESAIVTATQALLAAPADVIVLTTGLGVRSWIEAVDALHLGDALRAALSTARLYARGPKATGALLTAGFEVAWTAPNAQYRDVIERLTADGVAGQRIGVQLDGAGAVDLCRQITELGATVVGVPVYRWSIPDDLGPAERLIRAVAERRVDAVTFTARPAVDNFLDIAAEIDLFDDVAAAISAGVVMACVGPVCARGFTDRDLPPPLVPERHRLGALVYLLAQHFAARRCEYVLAGEPVTVRGRLVTVGDTECWLTDRERALLGVLAARHGAVVTKHDLAREVWGAADEATDEHVVEVTISRLRKRLGAAGPAIETVNRRGYRLAT